MAAKSTKSTKPKLASVPLDAGEDAHVDTPVLTVLEASDEVDVAKADAVKLKDLLSEVVTKTGAKKKDAKEILDAVLAEMAAALSAGKSLNLPPLGNMRVVKTQDKGTAKMLVLRLRMGGAGGDKDTLAEDGEDS